MEPSDGCWELFTLCLGRLGCKHATWEQGEEVGSRGMILRSCGWPTFVGVDLT